MMVPSNGKPPQLVAERDPRDWDEDKEPELWVGRYSNIRKAWEIDDPEEFL